MKLQNMLFASVVALLLLSAGPSFAAHPLIGDDAGILGKRNTQVELNGDFGTDKETAGGSTTKTISKQVATSIGVGVTDKIDLAVGFARPWSIEESGGVTSNSAGSADFSLTMKWQVYEHGGFSAAVKPQLGYSYTVHASDDHNISYGAVLILSKELEPFALHLNAGYTYKSYNLQSVKDVTRSSIMNISLAATYDVINRLKLVADVGTATNEDKTSNVLPTFGLVGAIYSLNKNLDLSFGLKAGLTKTETDLTGLIGTTFKF